MDEHIDELDPLLSMTEVTVATRLSRASVYKWMRKGRFPLPLCIGGRRFWRSSEIAAWRQAQPRYQPAQEVRETGGGGITRKRTRPLTGAH